MKKSSDLKRKNDEPDDVQPGEIAKRLKIPNVKKTSVSEDLKLTPVCTITQQSEIFSSFCLQTVDDIIVVQSKCDVNVLRFKKVGGHHQEKLSLASTKFNCSEYSVAEGLKVDQRRIFSCASQQDKNEIMLNPQLIPNCVPKNFLFKKAHMSPYSKDDELPAILARLTTHGSLNLSLYLHDPDSNETTLQLVAELCEIRKKSFDLTTTISKIEKLRNVLEDLVFKNFEWCPVIVDSNRLIATVTKTNELIFYSITKAKEVVVMHSEKVENVVSSLKWIVKSEDHFLIVGDAKGTVMRYSISIAADKSLKINKLNEIAGKLKIPVSFIEAECFAESILVLCAKAHSLEIILIKNKSTKAITKYVGLSITGITKIGRQSPEYLVSTFNNKIFCLELSTANGDLQITNYQKVDNTTSNDDPAKFSTHGIVASKNKVLIFIGLYPQMKFDHLTLKQQFHVSVNMLLTKNDPYKILFTNPTRKLTNYYDCIEAVRMCEPVKLAILQVKFNVALTEEFLYELKLHLIVVNAKLIYYQTRSDVIYETLVEEEIWLKKTVDLVCDYSLLKDLSKREKLSNDCQLTMRCLVSSIKIYLSQEITKEVFKTFKETFRSELEGSLTSCEIPADLEPEICTYCQEIIAKDSLTCSEDHKTNRCIISKRQIPFSVNNFCSNCKTCAIDLKILKDVTGNYPLCPYCDQPFG